VPGARNAVYLVHGRSDQRACTTPNLGDGHRVPADHRRRRLALPCRALLERSVSAKAHGEVASPNQFAAIWVGDRRRRIDRLWRQHVAAQELGAANLCGLGCIFDRRSSRDTPSYTSRDTRPSHIRCICLVPIRTVR